MGPGGVHVAEQAPRPAPGRRPRLPGSRVHRAVRARAGRRPPAGACLRVRPSGRMDVWVGRGCCVDGRESFHAKSPSTLCCSPGRGSDPGGWSEASVRHRGWRPALPFLPHVRFRPQGTRQALRPPTGLPRMTGGVLPRGHKVVNTLCKHRAVHHGKPVTPCVPTYGKSVYRGRLHGS